MFVVVCSIIGSFCVCFCLHSLKHTHTLYCLINACFQKLQFLVSIELIIPVLVYLILIGSFTLTHKTNKRKKKSTFCVSLNKNANFRAVVDVKIS